MKQLINRTLVLFAIAFYGASAVNAQCTTANLNWDHLDYLDPTFVTLAQSQTQRFVIGTQRVTIAHNYTAANIVGENILHTGESSSYGTGADVQLKGNGTITYTFQNAVSNVKFSVYDIDYDQRVTVTAVNGATPVNITMARVGTVLTIAGSGTTSA